MTQTVELSPNPSKDGRHKLYIRITHNRRMKRMTTPYLIEKKDFNKKASYGKWVRTSDHRYSVINNYIKNKYREVEEAYKKLEEAKEEISAISILNKHRDIFINQSNGEETNKKETFTDFISKVVQRYLDLGQTRTSVRLNGVLSKFKEFLGERELYMDDFNLIVLKEFQTFLSNVKQNSTNTINKDLKSLRQAYKREILENPNLKYDMRLDLVKFKSVKTSKEKMNKNELSKFKVVELKEGSFLWHTRNLYLFSYYEAGIRFGDVCELEWKNIVGEEAVNYRMSKVSKPHSVPFRVEAKEILAYYLFRKEKFKYIFPILPANFDNLDPQSQVKKRDSLNTSCNNALKEIAKKAGIEKTLTFHTSRHSFAYITYKETKDVKLVQTLLNHSSLQETATYLDELTIEEKSQALTNLSL